MTRALVALALLGAGCGGPSAPPTPASGPLPAGVVARVGSREISAEQVARIAGAQRVGPGEAREAAVRDALLAEGAAARGLAKEREVTLAVKEELARRLLRKVLAEARATPLTEEELSAATARRWLELDRPEGFRTVHVVVRFDAKDDEQKKARGRALAEAIRAALLPISASAATMPAPEGPTPTRIGPNDDPDPLSAAFRKAVLATPTAGLDVKAEPLPPVSAAGRVLEPGEQYLDPDYVRAAMTLPARGALSPVVTSPFGAHVIMLLEKTPAVVLSGEERRVRLHDDIVNERARAAQKRLLAGLKGGRDEITPDATALLSLVAVDL